MANPAYNIEILHPHDSLEEWDRFVDDSPQGSIYSKSFWLKAITGVTGGTFRILAAFKGGNLFGGIGLHIRRSPLGNIMNCPILTPYNSIILKKPDSKYPDKVEAENLGITDALIQSLQTEGKYNIIDISNRPSITDIRSFKWKGWERDILYTYEIPLYDLDAHVEILAHSIRKQIRKSQESGIRVAVHDDPEKFYSLFSMPFTRQKRAAPVCRSKFYELINELRPHNCYRMYFAELESGEAVSARIALFTKNETAHDWVAGADPAYFQTGATPFLLWNIMKDLAGMGYRCLDLNGANIEHIARFKSEFGGKIAPYYAVSKYGSPLFKLALIMRRQIQKVV